MTVLGTTIFELRKKKGLSSAKLASQIGLSKNHLLLLENGKSSDPRLSTLIALQKVLGFSIEKLVKDMALQAQD